MEAGPGRQELAEVFPDTFVHPAVREGMGAAPAPRHPAARLGYWCFETMTPLVAVPPAGGPQWTSP